MAINFDTLKTSEDNLRKMFLKYYNHVLKSWDYLYNKFKTTKKLSTQQLQQIVANEKRANKFEAEILDETSWIISKDMPRAAHLRYLIAVIRSIKDLERMGDFVERVAWVLCKLTKEKTCDPSIHRIVCRLIKYSHNFSKEIYRNICSGPHQTTTYYKNRASKLFVEFSNKYRECFKEVGEKIFKSKKDLNSKIAIFTAIKHIERNADHAFNILENFVYIGQPNFYFAKESRKS